jgi:hypothetical protein
VTANQLTATEGTELDDLEQVIEKGIATFIEVGGALTRIRDGVSVLPLVLCDSVGSGCPYARNAAEAAFAS